MCHHSCALPHAAKGRHSGSWNIMESGQEMVGAVSALPVGIIQVCRVSCGHVEPACCPCQIIQVAGTVVRRQHRSIIQLVPRQASRCPGRDHVRAVDISRTGIHEGKCVRRPVACASSIDECGVVHERVVIRWIRILEDHSCRREGSRDLTSKIRRAVVGSHVVRRSIGLSLILRPRPGPLL